MEGSASDPFSETDVSSASQAVNVDILLELADSGSDEEEESQTLQRRSTTDHDESDVFPSSGFCLPVGPDITEVQ